MRFRLFGVDVEIQLGFWIIAFFLGSGILQDPGLPRTAIGIWMALVFVSVLVHEFGHALAIERHRIEPRIALHMMGGTTSWRAILPLGRLDLVLISLAGPFAGFVLGGVLFGLRALLMHQHVPMPLLAHWTLGQAVWINIGWGLVNLIPVLPWDGGHVLEHALGPKRARLTAIISLTISIAVVAYCLKVHELWIAMLFALGGWTSFQRLRATPAPVMPGRVDPAAARTSEAPSAAVQTALRRARSALDEEDFGRAMLLAEQVLAGAADPDEAPTPPPPPAALTALEILGWAHLLSGRAGAAADALESARRIGPPDAALVGAVLLAVDKKREARRVFEAARATGDDRKEIVGPLVQLLIEQGETARAAATAFDIVDQLSDDDARHMAKLAFEGGVFDWSARLFETVFQRDGRGEDAYDAARALAKDRQTARAVELLQRAVDAGFSDRARLWSDAALEALREGGELEAVAPRP